MLKVELPELDDELDDDDELELVDELELDDLTVGSTMVVVTPVHGGQSSTTSSSSSSSHSVMLMLMLVFDSSFLVDLSLEFSFTLMLISGSSHSSSTGGGVSFSTFGGGVSSLVFLVLRGCSFCLLTNPLLLLVGLFLVLRPRPLVPQVQARASMVTANTATKRAKQITTRILMS